MVESIYNELLTRYKMGKEVLEGVAKDEGLKDLGEYDIRLLSIKIKDIDDNDDDAQRFIELRFRKDEDKDYEELVLVTSKTGAAKPIEDVEEALMEAATMLEELTEKVVAEFDNKVLVWDWLGD